MDDDRIIIRDKYGHSKSVHALQPKTAKDLMETESYQDYLKRVKG